jgi:serine protease Do
MPGVVGVYGMDIAAERFDDMAISDGTVGAGFFVDDDGTIVTAAHVTAGAGRIVVRLSDQRILLARRVGEDSELDIAVLKVEGAGQRPPPFGRATTLRPGDWVLAVGEPFGLRRSVLAGVVGGDPRHFSEDMEGTFIQSNITLNPGNSGGPLLTHAGRVVGMNVRTVVGMQGAGGVSLSIPIEVVLQAVRELQQQGTSARPRLGARFEDVSPPIALLAGRSSTVGATVREVATGGNADKAGFAVGDIIVGMNDRPVADSADLSRQLFAWRKAGGTRFVVFRGRQFESLIVPQSP